MDPVTHTLIGVGMGQAFFRRRLGTGAVTTLALASNLPDIDALVHFTADPAAITMRRSFGHSIFAFPVWSLVLGLLLSRRYPHIPWRTLFGLCLLGAGVHVFFDLVNSFGVRILWPFNPYRPELAIIFIIDLILLGLLAFPYFTGRANWVPACRVSMACVAFYVLFCLANRQLAQSALARETGSPHCDFSYVFPEPLGPHRWRGVLRQGGLYKVYLIHSLTGRAELKAEVPTALGNPLVEKVRESPGGRKLEAFFKAPVWRVAAGRGGLPEVRVFDLRFRSLVINRRGAFEYAFPIAPDGGLGVLSWAGRNGP